MMGRTGLAAVFAVMATQALAQDVAPVVPDVAPAVAPDVAVETGINGASTVTLYLHPFLTPEELATLRLVLTNSDALDLFVPQRTGFAALGVSPEDGFIRDAALVPSAQALGELPDADSARSAATTACDAARKGVLPCVVVLDIAPVP